MHEVTIRQALSFTHSFLPPRPCPSLHSSLGLTWLWEWGTLLWSRWCQQILFPHWPVPGGGRGQVPASTPWAEIHFSIFVSPVEYWSCDIKEISHDYWISYTLYNGPMDTVVVTTTFRQKHTPIYTQVYTMVCSAAITWISISESLEIDNILKGLFLKIRTFLTP